LVLFIRNTKCQEDEMKRFSVIFSFVLVLMMILPIGQHKSIAMSQSNNGGNGGWSTMSGCKINSGHQLIVSYLEDWQEFVDLLMNNKGVPYIQSTGYNNNLLKNEGDYWTDLWGNRYNPYYCNSNNRFLDKNPSFLIDSSDSIHAISFDNSTYSKTGNVKYGKFNDEYWYNIENVSLIQGHGNPMIFETNTMILDASFVVDTKGFPHITWRTKDWNNSRKSKICYIRWDGYNWLNRNNDIFDPKELNAVIVGDQDIIQRSAIKLDKNDNPMIVWSSCDANKNNGCSTIHLIKSEDLNWKNINGQVYDIEGNNSGSGLITSTGGDFEVEFDSKNRPNFLVFPNGVAYVKYEYSKWVGADGEPFDSNAVSSLIDDTYLNSTDASFTLDRDDNPHIVWTFDTIEDTSMICYTKWDGSAWVDSHDVHQNDFEKTAIIESDSMSPNPKIAFDNNNIVHIAWQDASSHSGMACIKHMKWATNIFQLKDCSREVRFKVNSDTYTINGIEYKMPVPTQLIQGRTMIPLRILVESFDGRVVWDSKKESIVCLIGPDCVELKIGECEYTVNGKTIESDTPPIIIGGQTFIFIRSAEYFGYDIDWVSKTMEVVLTHTP